MADVVPRKPQDRVRAILTSKVDPPMRLVLIAICDRMTDKCLMSWPSVEDVARRTGYCERQARAILNDLEARGLIRRVVGEHKSRDITINWQALEAATATPETRGGRRVAAKIAGADGGKDCHDDRQRLPADPAKIATTTGKDCPRSDQEAIMKRTSEATIARACEDDPGDTRKADPRSDINTASTLTNDTTDEEDPMQLFGKEIPHPADTRIVDPPTAPPLPSWVPKDTRPYARADVAEMVLAIVAEHRRPANLDVNEPSPPIVGDVRCKGDAKTILALWSYLERPPLGAFAADVIAVIRAAKPGGCPHRKFARDIRAEGWPEGTDRHRDLESVLRHNRWADRLEMAREWSANPVAYAAALPAVRPARGEYRSIADMVAEASAIPDPANPPRPNRDAIDVAYRVVQ